MNEDVTKGFGTNDKEVNIMPVIELIEYEKVAYVKEMEQYLLNLKSMKRAEAKKISKESLIKCQIIQEDGEFCERYKFSRLNAGENKM